MTRLAQIRAALGTNPFVLTLCYVAILLGMVVLYGRGELSSTGFIYQAF